MSESRNTEIEHVPRSTFFWVMGVFVTIHLTVTAAALSLMFTTIDTLELRVNSRIERVELRVDTINGDIRQILVGIEQVKARLGIIESGNQSPYEGTN